MTAEAVATRFRSTGRDLVRNIDAALLALAQYGHVGVLPNGRFLARRAA